MDSGELLLDGVHADIKTTKDARELGISIIYEEFNLGIGMDSGSK